MVRIRIGIVGLLIPVFVCSILVYVPYVNREHAYWLTYVSYLLFVIPLIANKKLLPSAVADENNHLLFILFFLIFVIQAFNISLGKINQLEAFLRTMGYVVSISLNFFLLPRLLAKRLRSFAILITAIGTILSATGLWIVLWDVSLPGIRIIYQKGLWIKGHQIIFFNPNYAGETLLFPIIASLFLIYSLTTLKLKLLAFLFFAINSVAAILTFSRSSYVTILAILLIYLFYKKSAISIITICLIIAMTIAYWDKVPLVLEIDRGMTGRGSHWIEVLDIIEQSLLLGWGYGGMEMITHPTAQNTFFVYFISSGIIGGLIYLLIYFSIIFKFLKSDIKDINAKAYISACILALLIPQMVRTYTLGGIGVIPFLYTIHMGLAHYLAAVARNKVIVSTQSLLSVANRGRRF